VRESAADEVPACARATPVREKRSKSVRKSLKLKVGVLLVCGDI
jgi:hypothetical protein